MLSLLGGIWEGAALVETPPPAVQPSVPGYFMLAWLWGTAAIDVPPPPDPADAWVPVIDPVGIWVPVEEP